MTCLAENTDMTNGFTSGKTRLLLTLSPFNLFTSVVFQCLYEALVEALVSECNSISFTI